MLRHLSKPIRAVLQWQLAVTVALALTAALLAGKHGAGLAAAFVASRSNARSAGGVLAGALTAEAVKIGLAVLLLGLVLTNYEQAVVAALIGSFVVTMLIFAMAFFVREH
jgi:hypothetical protein